MCPRNHPAAPPRSRSILWMLFATALLAIAIVAGKGAGQEKEQERPQEPAQVQVFMNRKLEHTEEALRGLVTGDLQKIAASGDAISLLCLDEKWNRVVTRSYLERTTSFRRTANEMAKAARAERRELAALHFLRMTAQCFDCHESIRKEKELPQRRR